MEFKVDPGRTIVTAMILGREISAMDVAWLRREIFTGGRVSRETAEELFAVARADIVKAREWTELFAELIVRHLLSDADRPNELGEAGARWLIERAGQATSRDGLAAIAAVLAEASRVPRWFLAEAMARAPAAARKALSSPASERLDAPAALP